MFTYPPPFALRIDYTTKYNFGLGDNHLILRGRGGGGAWKIFKINILTWSMLKINILISKMEKNNILIPQIYSNPGSKIPQK
jgi:transcriptional regulator CtsR